MTTRQEPNTSVTPWRVLHEDYGNILTDVLALLAETSRWVSFGASKEAVLPRWCRECEVLAVKGLMVTQLHPEGPAKDLKGSTLIDGDVGAGPFS